MNTAHPFDSENKVSTAFEVATLFLLLFVFLFRFQFDGNEVDVLPYAQAFYNSEWLSNDWYLHLHIPYRFLFSYPIGWGVETFGLVPVMVLGRLLCYLLFAWAMVRLKSVTLPKSSIAVFLIPFLTFLILFHHGFGAKEWIIGGFDTKVFSYVFVIASFAHAVQRKMIWSFLLAGAALSFHILIGVYNLFCLLPIFALELFQSNSLLKTWVKSLGAFLISGAIGLYGVVYQLFLVPAHQADKAWETYVSFRVPHHLIPSVFQGPVWPLFGFFTLINVFVCIKSNNRSLRLMSLYSLFMVLISTIGLLVFWFGPVEALRYYFFRFADGLLPLFSLIVLTAFVIEKWPNLVPKKNGIAKKILVVLIVGVSLPATYNLLTAATWSSNEFISRHKHDKGMAEWVRVNTSVTDVFLTFPFKFYWYIDYERPTFVSFKHAPQNPVDLLEWQRRMTLLNQGLPLVQNSQIKANFLGLDKSDLLEIKQLYPELTHALLPAEMKLDFPVLFETEKHILYRLPSRN